MSTEIRTFVIPDADPDQDRSEMAAFLRSVVVERIETAYSEGAWRMLVFYEDARRKEESDQIESAIKSALIAWRDQEAAREGKPQDNILSDSLLNEIAHFAPTTERELIAIATAMGVSVGPFGSAIVIVVKKMLDDLIE
ncbi:MAG: HRDC domain-containing protein [Rhodospirillaceae bacterium]